MTSLDELHNIFMFNKFSHGKSLQQSEYLRPIFDIAASEFADYKRMTEDRSVIQ
jgi:hypothetical protein